MKHELAVPEVTFELIFPTLGTMCIYFYFSQHLQYMYIFAQKIFIPFRITCQLRRYVRTYVRTICVVI